MKSECGPERWYKITVVLIPSPQCKTGLFVSCEFKAKMKPGYYQCLEAVLCFSEAVQGIGKTSLGKPVLWLKQIRDSCSSQGSRVTQPVRTCHLIVDRDNSTCLFCQTPLP